LVIHIIVQKVAMGPDDDLLGVVVHSGLVMYVNMTGVRHQHLGGCQRFRP
jgi:hypothetical protein